MGSIYVKGTRARPRYYLYFREGSNSDGSPRYIQRAAKGVSNKGEARAELARIEACIARGEAWEHGKQVVSDMKPCLERWRDTLTNRSATNDTYTINKDLIPRWSGYKIEDVTLKEVLAWVDELASSGMAPGTQRHRINLLSRFFSWAILNELTEVNPVKMIPQGKRPTPEKVDIPYLEDDSFIEPLMTELGLDLGLMFYLARFSGLREGEAASIRLSDLDWLHEGVIRVRYSFDGPLKESKNGSKPVKWVPAPVDASEVLKLHIARRRLNGAGPEDLLFPYNVPGAGVARSVSPNPKARKGRWADWKGWHPAQIRNIWRQACRKVFPASVATPGRTEQSSGSDNVRRNELTFYGATRHTFTTKALKAGASLDEVSAALGHSEPGVTKRHYDHLIRTTFGPLLRIGLTGLSKPS